MKKISLGNGHFFLRYLHVSALVCFMFCVAIIIFDVLILHNTSRYIGKSFNNRDKTEHEITGQTEQFIRLNSYQAQKLAYNIIIYWTGYPSYDDSYLNLQKPKLCYQEYPKCLITSNRVYLKHSKALIFNWRDFDQTDLPTRRSSNQLWVLYNLEPPPHVQRLPEYDDQVSFNLTATYRRDSDIFQPYGVVTRRVIPLPDSNPSLKVNFSHKSKSVVWFVSNCYTESRREEYVKQLSVYIDVDIYGECGPYRCNRFGKVDCYQLAAQKYLFYLSFENSFCKDYVTEKFFYILSYDMVPIVYGGANYSSILPPNSYIDASTMKPDELALLLYRISNSKTKYQSYFAWRQYYVVEKRRYTDHLYCKICERISKKQHQPYHHHQRKRILNSSYRKSSNISKTNNYSYTTKEINSWFFDGVCDATKASLLIDDPTTANQF